MIEYGAKMDQIETSAVKDQKEKMKVRKVPLTRVPLYDEAALLPLLKDIKPAPFVFGITEEELQEEHGKSQSCGVVGVPKALSCATCGGVKFESSEEQRQHFKLDWHRFNLKKRLDGDPAITEDQFEKILDQEQDNLSISGSDSEESDDDDDDDNTSEKEEASKRENNQVLEEDSETENENVSKRQRHPWLFFQNGASQLLSVHKCLLAGKKSDLLEDDAALVARIPEAVQSQCWAIFMLGGGHFAGAVFEGKTALLHKTFHCYTVRAKQGGSQSAADKAGGKHKSAGASLRRYNEMALVQHVQDIVKLWSQELKRCQLIFFRAASGNKKVLFGGREPPLAKEDPRLRSIPFPTRRATFSEVQRVHDLLVSVQLHGNCDDYAEKMSKESRRAAEKTRASPKKSAAIRRSKSRESPRRPLPEFVQDLADAPNSSPEEEPTHFAFESQESSFGHLKEYGSTPFKKKRKPKNAPQRDKVPEVNENINNLITACKAGNTKLLKQCIESLGEDSKAVHQLLNESLGSNRLTPLHLATASGQKSVIKHLLENGADPSLKDKAKKVPYNLCMDKETRNVYRTFSEQNPDRYDYAAAQIPPPPPPLTAEAEQALKDKKKAKMLAKKAKEKERKEKQLEVKKEEEDRQRYLGLSDREKRALAAERRILSQANESTEKVLARCYKCAVNISGKIPFEYEVYQFCTIKCLQAHKKEQTKS